MKGVKIKTKEEIKAKRDELREKANEACDFHAHEEDVRYSAIVFALSWVLEEGWAKL